MLAGEQIFRANKIKSDKVNFFLFLECFIQFGNLIAVQQLFFANNYNPMASTQPLNTTLFESLSNYHGCASKGFTVFEFMLIVKT
jgi:hypothetical protein